MAVFLTEEVSIWRYHQGRAEFGFKVDVTDKLYMCIYILQVEANAPPHES